MTIYVNGDKVRVPAGVNTAESILAAYRAQHDREPVDWLARHGDAVSITDGLPCPRYRGRDRVWAGANYRFIARSDK